MRGGDEEKSLLCSVPEILPPAGTESHTYGKLIGEDERLKPTEAAIFLADPVLLGTDKCGHSIPSGEKSLRRAAEQTRAECGPIFPLLRNLGAHFSFYVATALEHGHFFPPEPTQGTPIHPPPDATPLAPDHPDYITKPPPNFT